MTKKPIQKAAGFGLMGIAAIIVTLAVIGLVAWRFYDTTKTKTAVSSTTSSKDQASTKPSPKIDPYTNWKTYCDTSEKACFKYPSDWKITTSDQGFVSVLASSPTGSTSASYTNSDTRDGADAPYYTAALEALNIPNADYRVLGGFVVTDSASMPQYKVVDNSFTTGLTVGQQGTTSNTARFTFKDSTRTGKLEAYPLANNMTQDQAKAWFASADAKTALMITQSFYFQ